MSESGKLATALRKRRKVVAVEVTQRISPGLLTVTPFKSAFGNQDAQRERFERKRKARERRPRATFDAALDKLASKQARKDGYKGTVENTREFSRIANIPIRVLDLDNVTDLTSIFQKPEGEMTLFPIQSASLYEAHVANGLFAPIPVGEGKTLVALLMAEAMDSKKTVLLVPPQLRDQLAREIEEVYGPHFNIWTDRIKIIAYSELSLAKNSEILEEEDPDLIVADEVHNLRRKESARTKRFIRFMRENPHCRLVAMSGTMTSRSIMDYAHIIEFCLRKNSPLPNDFKELQMWAAALDVRVNTPAKPGALKRFLIPEDKGNIRLGYRRRLATVRGVITSPGRKLGTSLYIQAVRPACGIPDDVQDALDEVKRTWAYNGEEFATPIAFWRFCRQMSSGFYYRWVWPNGAPTEEDNDWLAARAAWHKAVREKLKTAGAGMDSKLLLENCAERWRKKIEDHSECKGEWIRGDDKNIWVPEACKHYPKNLKHCTGVKKVQPSKDAKLFKCEEFITWKKVKGRYNPSPPTEAVVISDFIIHDAIARAKVHLEKGRNTIIWYVDKIIGELLEKASGFPHYGAGTDASTATDDIIICSLATQGEGKNLQYVYSANVTITMPTNGKGKEQQLGRTHRPGQEADTVYDDYYDHTESLNKCMDDCIADAMYIEDTNGGRQKLLYADGEAIQRKKIMQRKIYESQKDTIAKRLNGESE